MTNGQRVRVTKAGNHNLVVGCTWTVWDAERGDGYIGLRTEGATAFAPRECLEVVGRGRG